VTANRYRAYGICIESAVPLPGLLPGNGKPDAVIRVGPVDSDGGEDALRPRFRGTADEGFLEWEPAGAVRVLDGCEVVVDPVEGADAAALRTFLLGPALGVLLTQRGLTALHASAVELGGRAVAFAGEAGEGKSTLAAALHDRGHPVVADDILAVRVESGTASVAPGIPELKLWPDALERFGDEPGELQRVRTGYDKRRLPTPDRFPDRWLELAAVYVLDEGRELAVEELGPADATIELIRHSWAARSLHGTAPAQRLASYAAVVEAVPVRRLRRPRSLAAVGRLAEFVEDTAA
jgi:hypothetical protein